MNPSRKQALKAQAHHLKPVVLVGSKGLTDGVIEETNVALTAHELIKVKVAGADKNDRIELINRLCDAVEAVLVQSIGNIGVLYRQNLEK